MIRLCKQLLSLLVLSKCVGSSRVEDIRFIPVVQAILNYVAVVCIQFRLSANVNWKSDTYVLLTVCVAACGKEFISVFN